MWGDEHTRCPKSSSLKPKFDRCSTAAAEQGEFGPAESPEGMDSETTRMRRDGAIFNSANFSSIATDAKEVIQVAAGFFRCLTKPIKVGEFIDTLDVTFATSKARRENRRENT